MPSKKNIPSFSRDDFASALDSHDYHFTVGQVVSGKIVQHTNEGTYIDIGAKSLAFLPPEETPVSSFEELVKRFPVDSVHEFLIIREQNEDGEVRLSLKRLYVMRTWEMLKEYQEQMQVFDCKVVGVNNGGLLAEVRGLRAFIPRSHLVDATDPHSLIGKSLSVVVLDLDEQRNRVILSHRQAVRTSAFAGLFKGQLITGKIASIRPFGVFVDFNGLSGLLHLKEISQKYVSDLQRLFQEGEEITAVILDVDQSRHRITLCTKIFELHPGEILENKAKVFAEASDRLEKNISQLWAG
ncbi:MAG: S1 RNA-binding domain-containing protein [Pseudanabaenaceae cyanobacterium]